MTEFQFLTFLDSGLDFPVPGKSLRIDLPVAEIINHWKLTKIKRSCHPGDFWTFLKICRVCSTEHFRKKTHFLFWLVVGGWTPKTGIWVKMSDSCISIPKFQITLFWLVEGAFASKLRSQKPGPFFFFNVPTTSSKNGHFESKSMMKMMKISNF